MKNRCPYCNNMWVAKRYSGEVVFHCRTRKNKDGSYKRSKMCMCRENEQKLRYKG